MYYLIRSYWVSQKESMDIFTAAQYLSPPPCTGSTRYNEKYETQLEFFLGISVRQMKKAETANFSCQPQSIHSYVHPVYICLWSLYNIV